MGLSAEQIAGTAPSPREPLPRARAVALIAGGVVTAAALAYVKWWPLAHKAAAALAAHHYSATSILTAGAKLPPVPSWQAAWSYAQAYFGAVWMAVVAGILIAGAVQALAPQRFFQRFLADSSFKSTLLAAVGALPALF